MNQFTIELNNGVINSKSRFNFKVFNALLDTNVRFSLIIFLLKHIGITINDELEFTINDQNKVTQFEAWLTEKNEYQKQKSSTIQVEAI